MSQEKPCAAYCRISNRYSETELSLKTQLAAIRQFAAREHLDLPEELVFQEKDSGYETSHERKALLQIRELARDGRIGALICHNTDRLAREPVELCMLVQELKNHGCRTYFVLTPIDDTPAGKALLFLRGVGHEMEWLAVRERATRVKQDIRDSGLLVGEGGARFGLTWDRKTRTRGIDPEAGPWVQLIFSLVADEGLSTFQVAAELDRRGIPTPAARKGYRFADGRQPRWRSQNVRHIIQDETYKGVCTQLRSVKLGRGRYRRKPRADWQEVPDGRTEVLVDADTWDRANAALRAHASFGRGAGSRNRKHFAFLRGRIVCAVCGRTLYVGSALQWNPATKRHSGNGHRLLYRCTGGEREPGHVPCPMRPVYEHKVRDAAWAEVVRVLQTDGLIEAEVARMKRDRPGEALFRDGLAAARSAAADADRKLRNLVASLETQDDPEIRGLIQAQMAQVKLHRGAHEEHARRLEEKLAGYNLLDQKAAELARRAEAIRARLLDPDHMTWEERRAVLDWLDARFAGNGTELKLCLDLGLGADEAAAAPLAVSSDPSARTGWNNKRIWLVF